MNFKDVFGEKEESWFLLSDKKREGRRFLQWAKELGCVWMNGEEIDPRKGTDFFVLSVRSGGILANVPAMAVASERFKAIERVRLADFERRKG